MHVCIACVGAIVALREEGQVSVNLVNSGKVEMVGETKRNPLYKFESSLELEVW